MADRRDHTPPEERPVPPEERDIGWPVDAILAAIVRRRQQRK